MSKVVVFFFKLVDFELMLFINVFFIWIVFLIDSA